GNGNVMSLSRVDGRDDNERMAFTIDPTSGVPPYEQLRSQVTADVDTGARPAGSSLPTVRALAAELGLAVNTVAKAYRALEADGVIETRGRSGSFVAARHLDDPQAGRLTAAYVAAVRDRGLSRHEALVLVDQHWPA
ncbi:MAG: GntR family transcriptional regulator, partial [Aeromicrobium sp.]